MHVRERLVHESRHQQHETLEKNTLTQQQLQIIPNRMEKPKKKSSHHIARNAHVPSLRRRPWIWIYIYICTTLPRSSFEQSNTHMNKWKKNEQIAKFNAFINISRLNDSESSKSVESEVEWMRLFGSGLSRLFFSLFLLLHQRCELS